MIYLNDIIEKIKASTTYFEEKYDHFVIRCPYCGDSKKRKNVGHLYINKHIPVYRCNRCNKGGRIHTLVYDLTCVKYKLQDVVSDPTIVDSIDIKPKRIYNIEPLIYTPIFETDYKNMFIEKQKYLIDRIGLDLIENDELIRKYVIFDISELIYNNPILYNKMIKGKDEYKVKQFIAELQKNYIGFITYNNNEIIFRNINTLDNFRYWILKVNDKYNDYFIINKFLNFKKIPVLVMAEGVFDILVPYKNIYYNNKLKNTLTSEIYIACKKSYVNAIKFISISMAIPQFNVIILSDSSEDINMGLYENVYKNCKPILNKLTILTNYKYKDFGMNNIYPTVTKKY